MRKSNHSGSLGSRLGLMLLLVIFLRDAAASSVYTVKGKVMAGVTASSPHRAAIGIACSEQTLRGGMSLAELGLSTPSEYSGAFVKAVDARVESTTRALVVITYKAIGTVVKDGDMVVYFGTCGPGGTTWNVGGTMPKRYWPRNR